MPGPVPKPPPQRRRRNVSPSLARLPAEGRSGTVPVWPLTRATKAEAEVWGELWRTPQAVAWERLGWLRTVARYARLSVLAERKDARASLLAEVRQLEDRLGLSPMAMLRLRWEIVVDDEDEEGRPRPPSVPSTRRHLMAVDPEGGAGSKRPAAAQGTGGVAGVSRPQNFRGRVDGGEAGK